MDAIQGLPLHVCNNCIKDYADVSQGLDLFVLEVDINRAVIIKVMQITFNIFGVAPDQLEQGREY